MRTIVKGREPASLTTHRNTVGGDYENYSDKDALRTALIAEQRGLCCYCMCAIRDAANSMKIEHWQCQTNYSDRQLIYRNLLGACRGGEGSPPSVQHCDTSKGDQDLLWNPADPGRQIEERIGYGIDGTIDSDDGVFRRQLEDVLNLNLPRIRNQRKAMLDGVLQWWHKQRRPVSRQRVEREIERWNTASPERRVPYAQVAIWALERKLESPRGPR